MITLSRRGGARLASGHPWIFRDDVAKTDPALRGGDLSPVRDSAGRLVGAAAWSDASRIAVRLLPLPGSGDLEVGWWSLVDAALDRRSGRPPCARLVNGDADGLPGLVVDRYGAALSIQTLSQAADRRKEALIERLRARLAPTTVVLRNDPRVRELEGLAREKAVVFGPAEVEAPVGPLLWRFDLLEGQKTGGFLDQQDNHLAAATFLRGEVLDCFCYDGGFALPAAHAGARVRAVDQSAPALARVADTAARHGLAVACQQANVFELLRDLDRAGARYDGVVLDPPAFAKSRSALEAGRRAYKEINLRAFKLLRPGGRLVTCTCSAHVARADFEAVVAEAAADAGRFARVVERRGAAVDHPSMLTAPETDYLKVLFVEVS